MDYYYGWDGSSHSLPLPLGNLVFHCCLSVNSISDLTIWAGRAGNSAICLASSPPSVIIRNSTPTPHPQVYTLILPYTQFHSFIHDRFGSDSLFCLFLLYKRVPLSSVVSSPWHARHGCTDHRELMMGDYVFFCCMLYMLCVAVATFASVAGSQSGAGAGWLRFQSSGSACPATLTPAS